MTPHRVSIVRYQASGESVRQAVDLAGGLPPLKPGARVFIKPNIVFWTRAVPFPKWGVITTSRVVEDMVALLKAHGVDDITIGEGVITADPRDRETPAHAFATLGYDTLAKRYGVKTLNVIAGDFAPVEVAEVQL